MTKVFVLFSFLLVFACSRPSHADCVHEGETTPCGTHKASSHPSDGQSSVMVAKGRTPAERDQRDSDGVVRRGMNIPVNVKAMSVDNAVAQAKELDGKSVLLEGVVSKVCARKGCWWTMRSTKDPSKTIRITANDYAFFVPKDAVSMKARAMGVLKAKFLDRKTAQHLLEDGLKKHERKNAGQAKAGVELRLTATAIEMQAPHKS